MCYNMSIKRGISPLCRTADIIHAQRMRRANPSRRIRLDRQKRKGQIFGFCLLIYSSFVKKLRRRGAFSFAHRQPAEQSRQPHSTPQGVRCGIMPLTSQAHTEPQRARQRAPQSVTISEQAVSKRETRRTSQGQLSRCKKVSSRF